MTTLNGLAILLLRRRLTAQLERLGAGVDGAESLQVARQHLAGKDFDFALLDVNLPDGQGPDLLREKTIPANTGVVVITAHGGVAGAVEAMQLGASDYLVKPFEAEELPLVIERARRVRQTARIEEHRREDADTRTDRHGTVVVPRRGAAGSHSQQPRVWAAVWLQPGPCDLPLSRRPLHRNRPASPAPHPQLLHEYQSLLRRCHRFLPAARPWTSAIMAPG